MVRRTSKEVTTFMRIAAAVVTIMSVYFFAPWKFALYYISPLPISVEQQTAQAVEQFVNTNGNDTVLLNKIIYNQIIDILRLQNTIFGS